MQASEVKRIARRIFLIQQANLQTTAPFSTYLVILIAQLPKELLWMALAPMPAFIVVFGMGLPYAVVSKALQTALAENPGEKPGARLTRILKLPRVLEFQVTLVYMLGALLYLGYFVLILGMPSYIIPWGCGVLAALVMLVMIWTRVFIERVLMPVAIEERLKHPEAPLIDARGPLWPRQSWYLPYSFALFVLCTILTTGTIVARAALTGYHELLATLDETALRHFQASVSGFTSSVWLPLLALGLFMLVSASLSAMLLTRHQERGFSAIREAIEGFAIGAPKRPAWVSTDELGELSHATSRAYNKLRDFSLSLGQSANSLSRSAHVLDESNTLQNTVLTRQAAALQETQVTAQEIRQTSLLAAQKAEGILQQAETVERLGRDGTHAIEQSVSSLQEIHEQVSQMASRIKQLDEHTRKIANITSTVKDLADQSNMLALNAAIEAVRSGEHGKGFGVVAREIRSLADQSIRATNNVRQLLQDINRAIRSTVEMTEQGASRVSSSVEQVRGFGDNMRQLSSIMQDNALSVRQISAAVNQQTQGIVQIFDALKDLNNTMNDTLERLDETSSAAVEVRGVATQVVQLVSSHGWKTEEPAELPPQQLPR